MIEKDKKANIQMSCQPNILHKVAFKYKVFLKINAPVG
ncbi:hypothetical protein DTO96_100391 [Ephemeroptericola cinctiostellae]|uniref:Uncharacterized protein n=1 Tax=Ephemeroptericola cinctiostellae TaxID=2268024 RepID=A0A345D8J3_9BURK|nr:hypothetical protein DTO96_100391 [Ephemeroptericola cinctiostellae]